MKFSDIVKQSVLLLQEAHRITYRALKLEFDLTDEQLEVLKEELIEAREGDSASTPYDASLKRWSMTRCCTRISPLARPLSSRCESYA